MFRNELRRLSVIDGLDVLTDEPAEALSVDVIERLESEARKWKWRW